MGFKLSRIYAEGWNMAKALPADESADIQLDRVAALNPYAAEPERSRWDEGFSNALER
jgi:hypothetical protein